jgi:CRP-like cAMP-binding protein
MVQRNDHTKKQPQAPAFNLEKYMHLFSETEIPARTTLLHEGEVARKGYFIRKGCLRLWFNHSGRDITFQFFFENEAVSSIESFRTGNPSLFSIESIEPTTVLVISKKNFELLEKEMPAYHEFMENVLFHRIIHYSNLFLSRIKDSPEKRYLDLLQNNPELLRRVPQHYIASFLGITPVSLSRIRNKVAIPGHPQEGEKGRN